MLFDDAVALRTAVGLFRSGGHGVPSPPVVHRFKTSSSGDILLTPNAASRGDSLVDLDLHMLINSPRSMHETLDVSDSDLDDDGMHGNNSPADGGSSRKGQGDGVGGDDGQRRSISNVTTSSVDLVIERLPSDHFVKVANEQKVSMLSDLLECRRRPATANARQPPPIFQRAMCNTPPPDDANLLKLTIYLPDRSPYALKVAGTCTVDEVIRQVLQGVRSNPVLSQRVKLHDHAGAYELRLHEGDGEADEDFPALDRQRKVKHFGEGSDHEYCLREAATPRGVRWGGESPLPVMTTPRSSVPSTPLKPSITVTLPNRTQSKMDVDDATTVRDLLQMVLRQNHRLQFSADCFSLYMTEAERQRRRAPVTALDGDACVVDLGVEEVVLRRKTFADDPSVPPPYEKEHSSGVQWQGVGKDKQEGDDRLAGGDAERRPDPESFVFADVTAFVYKEWNVVKRNKFGRKQPRIIGLDDSKIYNYKRDSRGYRKADGVYRAERPISSVLSVQFVDEDNKTFQIKIEEDGSQNTLEYTAETAYECAEIVYKLRYVLEAIARAKTKKAAHAPTK